MKRGNVVAGLVLGLLLTGMAQADSRRLGPTPHKSTQSDAVAAVTCSNSIIQDCGFENGPNGGVWTDASTNFGSPVCSDASCGTGGSTVAPYNGTYWLWLGGTTAYEVGSVTQSVVLPANSSAEITFWFQAPICNGDVNDFAALTIDGQQLWKATGTDAACNITDAQQQISVDATAFADGGTHVLQFHSITNGLNAAVTNFFIDDVDVVTVPLVVVPPYMAVPAIGLRGGLLLGLLLLLVAGSFMRKRSARVS